MSIGFRPARIRAMQRKFGLGPPPSMYALFKYTRGAFVWSAFPITGGQSLQWNIYPSIGRQNFRQRQKKGRGVFGGLAFCPWLLDCPATTHPSIAGRQANLSVFQRAETRDQCAFPFREPRRGEIFGSKIDACPE